jgi:transcriptional regulator with XRE-family HTH domain
MRKYLREFARNLKDLREEARLTYRELEDKTGIPKSSLEAYEKCKNNASLDTIIVLAKYYNVNLSWLIGESEERGTYGKG